MSWLPKRVPGARMLMTERQRQETSVALNIAQKALEDTVAFDVVAFLATLDADDIQHMGEDLV